MIILAAVVICILAFVLGFLENGFAGGAYASFGSGIISVFVIIGLFLILNFSVKFEEVFETQYEICSLEFEKEQHEHTEGTFFLGIGKIVENDVEKEVYYFITNEEKGKRIASIDNKEYTIYIKEDDSQSPKLQKVYRKYDHSKNKLMMWLFGIKESRTETREVIIVVPTNTVKVDYNVSLH